jgi:hypothetical protein
MGLQLNLRVFKGPDAERFREVFLEQVEQHGGQVFWDCATRGPKEDLRTTHHGNVHTVYLPYLSGADYLLCRLVGAALEIPWMEIRIQEGTLWDYSLSDGATDVDQFSTLPEYWEQDVDEYRGNPGLLARLWQIPQERVERYLRHWGVVPIEEGIFETVLKGKAYETDENEYGVIYQMFDFLGALGAIDPMAHGKLHRMIVPPIEMLRKANALL